MAFQLPLLPYEMNALEPYISKQTMEFHYGKHHQAYVDNLNKLIIGTEFENISLETIIKKSSGAVFNNAAQVWNHTFYWNCFASGKSKLQSGKLWNAIDESFGSFELFREKFSIAAATLFGSGWVWLVKTPANKLEIIQESNAGNPLKSGNIPILTCDVWEHAYYLDKQNRRPAYIEDFWKIINWEKVEQRI